PAAPQSLTPWTTRKPMRPNPVPPGSGDDRVASDNLHRRERASAWFSPASGRRLHTGRERPQYKAHHDITEYRVDHTPRLPTQPPRALCTMSALELLTHSVWESSPGDEAAGEREEPVVDVGAAFPAFGQAAELVQ